MDIQNRFDFLEMEEHPKVPGPDIQENKGVLDVLRSFVNTNEYSARVLGEGQNEHPGNIKGIQFGIDWLVQQPSDHNQSNPAPVSSHGQQPSRSDELEILNNYTALNFAAEENSSQRLQSLSLPPHLKSEIYLHPYQQHGLNWLQNLSQQAQSLNYGKGALLADDMGLGKTLQTLSFVDWHAHTQSPEELPYLIIAPNSVLTNWEQEYAHFFNHRLEVQQLKSADIRGLKHPDELQKKKIYLTTYQSLAKQEVFLGRVSFAAVIFDEIHMANNPKTNWSTAAKSLKARFRMGLSGTPLQNDITDIWNIFDILAPGHLGTMKDFQNTYAHLARRDRHNGQGIRQKFQQEVGPYILRRNKDDHLNLPEKEEHFVEIPMTPFQIQQLKDLHSQESQRTEFKPGWHLRVLQQMAAIDNYPISDFRQLTVDELLARIAKLSFTLDILQAIQQSREKVLIFSSKIKHQDMLQHVIHERLGYRPEIINGKTKARQRIIEDFSATPGFGVLILSPETAGVGLNITSANHVIHYARCWNHSKEQQANDRVHRMGQEKKVRIYIPISVHEGKSFDSKLHQLIHSKQNLAELFMPDTLDLQLYNAIFQSPESLQHLEI